MANKNTIQINKNLQPTEVNNNLVKIIAINVNSIKHNYRRFELLTFLNNHKPDIALLSETKLNQSHIITFADYDIIRTDRPNSKNGGGTAIVIRKNINYDVIKQPSS